MESQPAPGSEFAYGASLSAHGHFILRYSRISDELNAPKGKRRMRTLSRNPALFLPGRRLGSRVADSRPIAQQFPARQRLQQEVGDGCRLAKPHGTLDKLSATQEHWQSDDRMGSIAVLNVKKARIPPLSVDRWPAGLLDKVNRLSGGNLQAEKNVFCTLANYPRLFVAWLQLGVHALGGSSLAAREREMVILRTTALAEGRYPFAQHVEIGLGCGLNREDVAALLAGPSSPHWRKADRRLLKAVDELLAGNTLNDSTWDLLRCELSVVQCMDVAATVAFYRLAAWLLNACRTPLEDGQEGIETTAAGSQARLEENAYAGEPRILPVPPEDWPLALLEETAKWPGLLARPELRRAGVYVTFANHPALFQAIGGPAVHILNVNSLPDRAREVAVIRACARARGAYPYRQHVGIGRSAGVTESEIAALGRLRPTGLGEEAQTLVDMVDRLYRDNDLDDGVWARAQAAFSNDQIMDAILICGFYGLISAVLNVARTPLEPGSDSLPKHFIEQK